MEHYDLIVIGSGPAGEKGAAQAAYFGKRVALIERSANEVFLQIPKMPEEETVETVT